MKICILSDSHDNRELLKKAGEDAQKKGAQAIIHAGDVVAPSTLVVLIEYALPVHVICGNNTGDLTAMHRLSSKPENKIQFYGHDATIELAGKKIFVVHYPHYAEGMALTGKWDIVCCGHSHDVSIKTIKNILGTETVMLNPGTVGAVSAKPTYILADLDSMTFEVIELGELSELDQKQARFTI